MIKAFFAQPRPLSDCYVFEKPEIFTGEYGRILELLFGGVMIALAVAIMIVVFMILFKK